MSTQSPFFIWFSFSLFSLLIAVAGHYLSFFAEIIAEKTHMGRNLAGLLLLGTVTSLPELTTGISSVLNTGEVDLAVGDVLGSCAFNLCLVFFLDLFYRQGVAFTQATNGHILSLSFSFILLSLVGMQILFGGWFPRFTIFHISPLMVAHPIIYILAILAVFRYQKINPPKVLPKTNLNSGPFSLQMALGLYLLATIVILFSGIQLPKLAEKIVHLHQLNATFVGSFFLAIATSLPEVAATFGAIRLQAVDLALGNLLGSNLFNLLILFFDELVYTQGALLYKASPLHLGSVFILIVMNAVVVLAIIWPPQKKIFNFVTSLGLVIFLTYLTQIFLLYQLG